MQRNLIIGLVAILALAAIGAAFFLGRRDADEPVVTATTPTATQTTPTVEEETQTVVTVTVPAEAPPEAPPVAESANQQLEIVARSAVPETVPTNGPMEFIAEIRGDAISATMTIRGPQDSTVSLNKGITTPGGITIWRANTTAPSLPGIYRFYASATAGDGTVVEMPGVSGWSFQVTP